MKRFKFGNHQDCYLEVGHYKRNHKAMAITVTDFFTGEEIKCLTVFNLDFHYQVGFVTIIDDIVDGSMFFEGHKTGTQVLGELGIIDQKFNTFDYLNDYNDIVKIAICYINLKQLEEYSNDWNYWDFCDFEEPNY